MHPKKGLLLTQHAVHLRIAILNEDVAVCVNVEPWLVSVGHTTQRFIQELDFRIAARTGSFDALVMTSNSNDLNAIAILGNVRHDLSKVNVSMAVVLITPHSEEDYVVRALRAGADAYITTPLRRHEFLARLEAVTRRHRALSSASAAFQINHLKVDCASRRIFIKGPPVELSAKEFDLAVFLLTNLGWLLARSRILQAVWGNDVGLNSRTLDTHMSRVRRKLQLTEENGLRLTASYGLGYRLERVTP